MIRKSLFTLTLVSALAIFAKPVEVSAQAMESVEPFKVGTFAIDGVPTVGLVVRDDSLIVDVADANRAMELLPAYAKISIPADMLGFIEQYDYGLKYRVYEVMNWLVEENLLSGNTPDYIHPVSSVDIMAPILYPSKIMNAAVNFYTHACEGCNDDELARRTAQRQENRGVPYLFLKPTRGAVIGSGEDVIMPYGRDRIEYEVEMAIVFGRTGKYVSADRAYDHVFGYMVAMDVSDRGGRPPGGYGSGSDWFVGKGHDTFAPHGPWIVPKEFYGDPMERLHQITVVDGVTVQEARAGDMIHNIPELIEYASSLISIFPGDVMQSGTSGGTGAGRVQRATGSGYLIDGETISATIEGIGTLTHTVRAETSIPSDLSGAQLPPTSSYRD
ncbi:MAG: fumarylacetoacetate hydrolase family protein [Gammaproteobacteria bacterium]|jgi:2-keto-4-pentenoate hydratase/2-oxohepta-3-ene-1,7-dioic acid hydratase in catechol pathway|nr:fumarylacetoacetate hydrolase family protein [Gammaproteobacteria bacterium]MBT3859851.1 fumarylacetoacetate hydrolase family protein [Gammaproteobacteria bacterium]MBT3988495.1 fumarylacetoacetate hydrolase family protein [Gammaproteobacteria bacterium]MBT4254930.1 fumarylacetoacetate hydrolase family protein [Gammaproteobacteria bacterium]MBT4583164.1 fumarylacetoacetate hydrolase family protein [Gammaproteobacteria bacterium]